MRSVTSQLSAILQNLMEELKIPWLMGSRHKKGTSPLPLIQAQHLCIDLLHILGYHTKFEEIPNIKDIGKPID